jgi:hypothetical protein
LIIHLQACVGLKNSPLQTTLKLQPKGKSNLSPEDQDEADRLLLRVIVGDERLFSFAQTTRFQEFCKKIAPEYKIPVDNTLDKKFQEEFETTKVVLNKLITSLPAFSITMDGWKSMCGDSYASFEVHFWDFKCNKKTTRTWTVFVIDVVHCTGEVVAGIMRKFFAEVGIPEDKLSSLITTSVTDGGGNIYVYIGSA